MLLNIEKFMNDKGLSKKDLSKKSGVALSFINYIIEGEKSPTLRTVEKLADALGVTVAELLTDQQVATR